MHQSRQECQASAIHMPFCVLSEILLLTPVPVLPPACHGPVQKRVKAQLAHQLPKLSQIPKPRNFLPAVFRSANGLMSAVLGLPAVLSP